MFQNSRQAVRASVFALSVVTLFAAGNAAAGRMFDLVPKPVQADAASISRGNSAPRALVHSWHTEAVANQTQSAPEQAGRMFSLVVKPAQADAASISRGNGSLNDLVSTSPTQAIAQSRTGVVKSGEFVQRDARCEVRDVCSAGSVGAITIQSQPSIQAQGEALTTIR